MRHAALMSKPSTHRISKDLLKLVRPLEWFHLDPENARTHDDSDLSELAGSLSKYGQQKPVVVLADGKVIAGNGTVEAARRLGWTGLAAVTFDSEADAVGFALADNRTAELSRWNEPALARALERLRITEGDLIGTGFTSEYLDGLIDRTFLDGVTASAKTDAQLTAAPEPQRGASQPTRESIASIQSFTFTVVLTSDQHATIVRAIDKVRAADKNRPTADCLVDIAAKYLD